MPKNTNDKTDETTQAVTETQTVAPPANDAPNDAPPSTENDGPPPSDAKPHRKSNYITLAPGQPSEMTLIVAQAGSPATVPFHAVQGQVFHIVPDDSSEHGVSETLASSLLEGGRFVYTDKPDKDAEPAVYVPAPETPAGALLANQSPAPEYSGPPRSPSYAGAANV